jgi:hypothetical protein
MIAVVHELLSKNWQSMVAIFLLWIPKHKINIMMKIKNWWKIWTYIPIYDWTWLVTLEVKHCCLDADYWTTVKFGQLIRLILRSLHVTSRSQCIYCYFLKMLSMQFNLRWSLHKLQTFNKIVWAVFKKIAILCFGAYLKCPSLSLELEYSYSLSTDLWSIDSETLNLYKINHSDIYFSGSGSIKCVKPFKSRNLIF